MLSFYKTFFITCLCFFVVLLAISCSTDKRSEIDTAIIQTLDESSNAITISSANWYVYVENRLNDPVSAEIAKLWHPKLEKLKRITEDIIDYTKKLEGRLANEEEQSQHTVTKTERGLLVQRLYEYKNDILHIDARVMREFGKQFLPWVTNSALADKRSLLNQLKEADLSNLTLLVLLSKVRAEICIMENRTAAFLSTQFTNHQILDCSFESPIIAQSSSQVRAGERFTITAGIGSFKIRKNTEILIAGKSIQPNEGGVTSYSFAAPREAGEYHTLVKLSFLNNTTGKYETTERYIQYTVVAAPCDTIP